MKKFIIKWELKSIVITQCNWMIELVITQVVMTNNLSISSKS